jgi:methionyl-tRNA formyltransferase
MNNSRKIVFFGSPIQSAIILQSLIDKGHEIVGVITQKDKRRSRGNTLFPTPVKSLAIELGLDVYEPETKQDIENIVKELVDTKGAQVGIVVAFGKILTPQVLNAFRFGCINVHYSLLPRWRGAAPVERAILEGDTKTGISIMSMDEGLDTGPVYKMQEILLEQNTTSKDLYENMADIAKESLNEVLDDLENIKAIKQIGDGSYAKKLENSDFVINAQTPLKHVSEIVRAGTLIKGAFVDSSIGKFRILEVGDLNIEASDVQGLVITRAGKLQSCEGALEILKVQSENKPAMAFNVWVNGIDKSKFDIEVF